MSIEFRRTATCQALVACVVRHLRRQRAALVDRIPADGGRIAEGRAEAAAEGIITDPKRAGMIGLAFPGGQSQHRPGRA